PETASGLRFTSVTLTVVPAGALQAPLGSHATTVKVSVSPACLTSGAVKEGFCAVALLSTTAGPLACAHRYVKASPSGSELAVPSRVSVVRSSAMSGADTDAIGAWLTWFTVTVVVAAELVARPSLTVTEKVRMVVAVTCGAVKNGEVAVALLSVTEGPPVCVQA